MSGGEQEDRVAGYRRQVTEENSRYDAAIASIKAACDAGEITPLQAALSRVTVMEEHLAAVRRLRRELLPGHFPPSS